VAARQRGLDPSEFVHQLVTENLPEIGTDELTNEESGGRDGIDRNHFYFTATRDEFNGALDEIARMNDKLPILTESAFDRENLYDDRL